MEFGIIFNRITFNFELIMPGHHLENIQFPILHCSWSNPPKGHGWNEVLLSHNSFQTSSRSKNQKKLKTRFWQCKNRSLLRNTNLQNSKRHGTVADCNKKNEVLLKAHGWGGRRGSGGGTSRT